MIIDEIIINILSDINKKSDQKRLYEVYELAMKNKNLLKGRITIEEIERQELNFLFNKVYKELEFKVTVGSNELIRYVLF